MKRILSLLCTLMLVCGGALADDFLLDQTLTMLQLTREKATLAELYTADTAAAERIAQAISGEVVSVSVLCFDNAGAFARFAQMSGEEVSGVSDDLASVLDASIPAALLTMLQSALGAQELATASMLTVASVHAPQDAAADALAIVDFGTEYVLACTYTLSPDGAVSCAARPVSAELKVLDTFCTFYGLTEEQIQVFSGESMK